MTYSTVESGIEYPNPNQNDNFYIFSMVIMRILILVILVCLCCDSLPLSDEEDGHYMNRFLVELHERSTAEDVARDHGFEIDDEVPV